MRLYDAAPLLPRFLVYWKHDDQQLFAFTTSVRRRRPERHEPSPDIRSPAAVAFWASSSR